MGFIMKFKTEKNLEPRIIAIPTSRSKHQEEVELERLISSTAQKIGVLRQSIRFREAENTKREQERIREEKKKHDEEKERKEAERKRKAQFRTNLISEFKEGVKQCCNPPANEGLNKLLNATLKQKRLVEHVIKEKYGEKELLEPKTMNTPQGKPLSKHPDDIELDRLISVRIQLVEDLEKVASREDRNLRLERNRTREANDEAQKRSTLRRSIKTFATAIRLEWNKDQIEALGRRLDRIRGELSSEVMLNIQKSVRSIKERTEHSDELLENMSAFQQGRQMESLQAIQRDQSTVTTLLQSQSTQLQRLEDAASKWHDRVIDAISAFTLVLEDRFLFPALPKILTEADPSLKSAALNGYDAIENAVLAALYFRKMDIREAQVQEAYKDTCSWIFKDPGDHQKQWSNFRRWLENEDGCYWIAGKAGCGKSTLMKFLRSDPRTRSALDQWADSNELITASYFFWMAGTALQKNQEGLLRSLLHSILSRRRDLIARVFPREYDAMMTK